MEVIGVAMKTHETPPNDQRQEGTCCTADDINDARRVCQQLDIPFYPMNFKDEFEEKVIRSFAQNYLEGKTPNPCVSCNDQLKFSALLKQARQLGAYYLATGHYAQRSRDRYGKYHLLKARDQEKDQTYFLFGLGQEQLEHVLFPIGKYTKDEVRDFARSSSLQTSEKPESQEICFVANDDYARFIEERFPEDVKKKGTFVDTEGKNMGEHKGIHAYTVGQRRGLGVATGERVYVTQIVPEENKVVLGGRETLLKNGLVARNVKWVHRESATSGMEVEVKIRHGHEGVPAMLTIKDDMTVIVEFREPAGAVTPGQVAVLYHDEEVLGGGWIEKGI